MSKKYQATVTMSFLGSDETDVEVRGLIELEPSRSHGWTASLDGDLEILHPIGGWLPSSDFSVEDRDVERAKETLCDLAFEDDTDQCVEADDYARDCA